MRKFKKLLYNGDYRAADAMQHMPDTSACMDAVLYACSHFKGGDCAEDENVCTLLYDTIVLVGSEEAADRLIGIFEGGSDRRDIRSVCRMGRVLCKCALNGNSKARVCIHDRFDRLMSSFAGRRRLHSKKLERDMVVAEEMAVLISEIDGMAGFLYVASRYGRLMVKKKDACLFFPHRLWTKAGYKFGADNLYAIMEEYFDKMEYLRAFYMAAKA